MFSPLRNRFGIPGVISVIALVFAMFGGAYAASDNGGSGSKASASAKKGPRGPKGPKGPAGPAGAQGPAGPAGAKGDTGAAGSNGKDGTNGTNGTNGKTVLSGTAVPAAGLGTDGDFYIRTSTSEIYGPKAAGAWGSPSSLKGKEGDPWTLGGTLPSEATETGVWRFISNGEAEQFLPISFPIPLSGADAESITVATLPSSPAPSELVDCPGTVEEPKAEPGFLCVYTDVQWTNDPAGASNAYRPVSSAVEEEGVITSGTLLYFEAKEPSTRMSGSFAVTAP